MESGGFGGTERHPPASVTAAVLDLAKRAAFLSAQAQVMLPSHLAGRMYAMPAGTHAWLSAWSCAA